MEKSKLVGHTASLNKNLVHYLSKFEKNQQWADVAPLLMKIEGLLKTHPSPYIEEKVQLAKRLAQCLNPQLTSPLHLSVLKIYDQIFKNMVNYNVEHKEEFIKMKLEDMAVFSVGLFPFFQHASSKVRPQYLELIQRNYTPLGRELIPMIAGLVSSILPGLDDQLEAIQKLVIQTLDLLQKAVGRRYLIGSVWMAILRIPRCRSAGVKYLTKAIARMPQAEDEDDEHDDDVDESDQEYSDVDSPDKETKEMEKSPPKSIIQVQSMDLGDEEEKQVNEQDQQEAFQEIKSAQLDNEEIMRKDTRRQAQLDELEENIELDCNENNFPNKSSLVLNAVIACLEDENQLIKRHILDFLFSHLKLTNDVLNEQDKLVLVEGALLLLIRKDLSVTRRVNQWLFGKPDMENKYQLSEKNQFVIQYVVDGFIYVFKNVPSESDIGSATFPIKLFQNFFMEHDHMLDHIIPFISFELLEFIYTYSHDHSFSSEVLKAGKRLVESTASHLALLIESITSQTMKADTEKTKQIISIVHFFFEELLDGESFEAKQIEALIKTSVSNLLTSLCNLTPQQLNESSAGVLASQLALQLLQQLELLKYTEQTNIADFDQALSDFGTFFQVITQHLADSDESQQLFQNASVILIKGQRFRYDKQLDRLPEWFACITTVIRDENPSIALLAIENMIELLISEKLDPIYQSFKNLIVEESRSKIQKNQMIQGFDYTKLTLEKLWSLLDYQYFHDRIIEKIVNLSKVFPQLYTDVVAASFNSQLESEKEQAIRRFAVFWKSTSLLYKTHFQSRELQELKKVGLFIMLDFLDHDNPMIRHTAKNWLLESIPNLHRILDPLFEVLVQSSNSFYVIEGQQVLFDKEYDTRRTNEAIKKLKSMLSTYSDLFLNYMQHTELSNVGKDIRLHFTSEQEAVVTKDLQTPTEIQPLSQQLQQLPQNEPLDTQEVQNLTSMTYLDLLVIICLRYIQGKPVETLSAKFVSENAAVNASACEFLELLVIHIDHASVSLRLAEYIMTPLQIVLQGAVESQNLVMQVQLLNLFKVVFFHSVFRRKTPPSLLQSVQKTMTDTVSNEIFLPTLIAGMSTSVLYVRAQYIQFISTCIPLLAEYLSWQTLTNCVTAILQAYFGMIKAIAERSNNLVAVKVNKFSTQEHLQGSQHEISNVLAGVKTILTHILGLEERDDIQYEKPTQQGITVVKIVKTVLTFGLSNVTDPNKFAEKPVFTKYVQTCEQIMLTLPSILELYINCWNCSEEFLTYAESNLTALGCDSYSFEKYNNYNKILSEQMKGQGEKNLVKPQILTMMKPLFMHYSKQFISSIIYLWTRECKACSSNFSGSNENSSKIVDARELTQNIFLQKTIELLVTSNCPCDLLLDSLIESDAMKDIQKYYSEHNKKKKQATQSLNFAIIEQEANILYFLYNYFKYVYIDPNTLKKEMLMFFWTNIMNVFRQLSQSKAPSTSLWLLELTLLLTRKYSPKEIIGDQKLRNDLHEFINEKLKFVASFGAKQIIIQWNDAITVTNVPLINPPQPSQPFRAVLPFNPSIFEIYCQLIDCVQKKNKVDKEDGGHPFEVTDIEIIMFGNLGQTNEQDLMILYRLYCIKTLKKIALLTLQNSYAMEKTDRVVLRTKEFMDLLFPLMNDKSPPNQIFVQTVSELLHNLLDKARNILMKAFRTQILELFNKEEFFSLNRKTLKYWENIINWVVLLDKGDLFSEYLEKVTLQSYFFAKDNDDNKKRIKSFERICFVIFSGDRDRFTKKLWTLIEKISEVIKSDNVHPSLLILILFCVRILILRLSSTQLSELFRNIWPMLLTLLIQIFNKHKEGPANTKVNTPKNINLVLAGLKLVEMISLTHQEDFFLNQWVFMYDYFGLKIEQGQSTKMSPFQYQPYFSNFVNQSNLQMSYKNVSQLVQTDCKQKKRNIVVQQVKVDSEEELEECALKLTQYLIHLNELRTSVDFEQVEELIENDFIHLDEFIFKI